MKPDKETLMKLRETMTNPEIAAMYGVHARTVGHWSASYRLERRNKCGLVEEEDQPLIKALYEDGMPVKEIADKWECSEKTIYRILSN